jgi:hypothetical protein
LELRSQPNDILGYFAGTSILGSNLLLAGSFTTPAAVVSQAWGGEQAAGTEISATSSGPQRFALANADFSQIGIQSSSPAADSSSSSTTSVLAAQGTVGVTIPTAGVFDSLSSVESLFGGAAAQHPSVNGLPVDGSSAGAAGGAVAAAIARESAFFGLGAPITGNAPSAAKAPDPQSVAIDQAMSGSVRPAAAATASNAPTTVAPTVNPGKGGAGSPVSKAQANAMLANLPLYFEPNFGQAINSSVKLVSNAPGFILELSNSSASFVIPSRDTAHANPAIITLNFVGGSSAATVVGENKLASVTNYIDLANPSASRTNLLNYGEAVIQNIYPGIDVAFFGNSSHALEYDFIVHPGADPSVINLKWDGITDLTSEARGNLDLQSPVGTLIEQPPAAFQTAAGALQQSVAVSTVQSGKDSVGFQIGSYDKARDLIIDPVVGFSSYWQGGVTDYAYGAAVDNSSGQPQMLFAGNHYTGDPNEPTSAFVIKLEPGGTGIQYGDFINMAGDYEAAASALTVDQNGNVYMAGIDIVEGASPQVYGILCRLDTTFTRVITKTFAEGLQGGGFTGVAVDNSGRAYVTGYFTSGPNNHGLYTSWAFVQRYDFAGNSSYNATVNKVTSGSENEVTADAVAVDENNNAVVTGVGVGSGGYGAMVWEVNSGGSVFPGKNISVADPNTPGDAGTGICVAYVNGLEGIYVTGIVSAGSTFVPITPNAVQPIFGNGQSGFGRAALYNAFVVELDPTQSLKVLYATYLGGLGTTQGNAIAVDGNGNVTVVGQIQFSTSPFASSPGFPTYNPLQSAWPSDVTSDGFISQIGSATNLSTFNYSTYWGGDGPYYNRTTGTQGPADTSMQAVAVDPQTGNVYVAGWTDSRDFFVWNYFQGSNPGDYASVVTEIQNS